MQAAHHGRQIAAPTHTIAPAPRSTASSGCTETSKRTRAATLQRGASALSGNSKLPSATRYYVGLPLLVMSRGKYK